MEAPNDALQEDSSGTSSSTSASPLVDAEQTTDILKQLEILLRADTQGDAVAEQSDEVRQDDLNEKHCTPSSSPTSSRDSFTTAPVKSGA